MDELPDRILPKFTKVPIAKVPPEVKIEASHKVYEFMRNAGRWGGHWLETSVKKDGSTWNLRYIWRGGVMPGNYATGVVVEAVLDEAETTGTF